MRDEALESIGMASHPVCHVTTIRSTRRRHPLRIDIAQAHRIVHSLHQIFVDLATPVVADVVNELLSKGSTSPWIRHHHHIALRREYLAVPAVTHGVARDTLRAAVDDKE